MAFVLAEKQGLITWPVAGHRYYADDGTAIFFATSDIALDFCLRIFAWMDEVRQEEFRVLGELEVAPNEASLNGIPASITIPDSSRGA